MRRANLLAGVGRIQTETPALAAQDVIGAATWFQLPDERFMAEIAGPNALYWWATGETPADARVELYRVVLKDLTGGGVR